MPLFIYTWNEHSNGADELKTALGIRKIRHTRSTFQGNPRKTVINWGSSELPEQVLRCQVLNTTQQVRNASNKLSFFQEMSRHNSEILPPWTTDFNEAVAWCAEGFTVCARTVLNSHSARGLVLMDRANPRSFVQAPLYTKYVKKEEEYRVHVVDNTVVTIQRKVLRRERAESGEPINWKVRNLDNGFVYQREGINPADSVTAVALEAMRYSGLTFGAVDVIYNSRANRSYVLEINTAPGLEGQTVQNYANAFRRWL